MTAVIITAVALAFPVWVAYRYGVHRGRRQGRESGYHAAIDDGWAQFNDRKREGL